VLHHAICFWPTSTVPCKELKIAGEERPRTGASVLLLHSTGYIAACSFDWVACRVEIQTVPNASEVNGRGFTVNTVKIYRSLVSLVSHLPCRVPDGMPSTSVALRVPQSKNLDLTMPSWCHHIRETSIATAQKAEIHPNRAPKASRTMTNSSQCQLHPSSWDQRHASALQARTVESEMSLVNLLANSTNIGQQRRGSASVASTERRRLRVQRDLASVLDAALAISDAFLVLENDNTN
jgi:hypothetical protein